MDFTLFKLREKHDRFLSAFGVSLILIGVIILIPFREVYFVELIGQISIQLGIGIIIINLLIAQLGNKLQQETIKGIFRDMLGIPENKKLISELDYIYKPTGYQVIYFEEKNHMIYEKDKKRKYNLKVIETRKVIIDVKKENSHYYFDRATVGEPKNKSKIVSLKLDKEELDLNNRRDIVSYKDYASNRRYFKIDRQLKEGRVYTIEYRAEYPNCMSDLNHKDIELDFIETRFIELTERAKISYKFPFDLGRYDIFLRRKDMSEFKYEPVPKKNIKIDKKNNEMTINESNLRNNDKIVMYYKKK